MLVSNLDKTSGYSLSLNGYSVFTVWKGKQTEPTLKQLNIIRNILNRFGQKNNIQKNSILWSIPKKFKRP